MDFIVPNSLRLSPHYPAIDLPTALGYTAKLLENAGRHQVAVSVAMTSMGFKAVTGPAIVTLSALAKYGLVDVDGRGEARSVRISDRAVRILRLTDPSQAAERDALIREAALLPAIYREIVAKYGGALPTDTVIGSWLELDRGFYGKAVPDVLRIFRSTLAYAGLDKAGKIELPSAEITSEDDDETVSATDAPTVPKQGKQVVATARVPYDVNSSRPSAPSPRTVQLAIGPGKWVTLSAPEGMTPAEWSNLEVSLKAARVGLVVEN